MATIKLKDADDADVYIYVDVGAGTSGDPYILSSDSADYDTGVGTKNIKRVGIALPGSGGPVSGGTSTNPIVVTDDGNLTLAANSGVDIGDVDILSVIPGTGATNLGKAVQGTAGATDTGVASLIVRDDALSTLTETAGEYVQTRSSSRGALWTAIDDIQDGAGTTVMDSTNNAIQANIVAGDALGDVYVESAASPATIEGPTLMMERDDVLSTISPLAGEWAAVRSSGRGALWTAVDDIQDGNGVTVMDTVNNAVQVNVVAGATGRTEYTEDAVTADPQVGTAVMMERVDAPGAVTPAAGDWTGLRASAEGALWTQDFNSDNILTAVQLIDDAVATDDAAYTVATDKGMVLMGVQTADSVDAGDAGAVAISTDRRLLVDAQIAGQDADVTIADGGNAITVDWNGTAPPIGAGTEAAALRVTMATNSTGVLSVDDNGGALTVDNAGTFVVQVDDLQPGTGAANLGKAEDAIHSSGDVGVMALFVRQDSQVDFGADGDYVPGSIDDAGNLRVNVAAGSASGTEYTEDAVFSSAAGGAVLLVRDDAPVTVAADGDWVAQRSTQYGAAYTQIVDSSGNFIDTFGGSGGTAAADDADFVAGTTQATPIMGVYESTPSSVTDGDLGVPGISSDRRLLVDAQIAGQDADVTIADGGNNISVDWGGTVPPIGSGTEAAALRVTLATDSTGVVSVDDNGAALTVDNAGTFATQVDGAALTALQLIDNSHVNHDAAVVSGVTQIGVNARSTDPTAVASADASRTLGTLLGKPVNHPFAIPSRYWDYTSTADVTDTADDVAQAAGGAGVRHYITSIAVTNSHASVDTYVVVKDGSTVKFRQFCKSGGGGISFTPSTPIRCTANTAVNVANITTGSATSFTITGYTAAE